MFERIYNKLKQLQSHPQKNAICDVMEFTNIGFKNWTAHYRLAKRITQPSRIFHSNVAYGSELVL